MMDFVQFAQFVHNVATGIDSRNHAKYTMYESTEKDHATVEFDLCSRDIVAVVQIWTNNTVTVSLRHYEGSNHNDDRKIEEFIYKTYRDILK